jgi:hypothetical protein
MYNATCLYYLIDKFRAYINRPMKYPTFTGQNSKCTLRRTSHPARLLVAVAASSRLVLLRSVLFQCCAIPVWHRGSSIANRALGIPGDIPLCLTGRWESVFHSCSWDIMEKDVKQPSEGNIAVVLTLPPTVWLHWGRTSSIQRPLFKRLWIFSSGIVWFSCWVLGEAAKTSQEHWRGLLWGLFMGVSNLSIRSGWRQGIPNTRLL